jgi:hypothetical protein
MSPVGAQDSARKGRAGDRAGEVITPPARNERSADSLREGELAPDFTLPVPGGKTEVTLSSFRGKQPVVLVFGSLTCPPFRRQVLDVDKLYAKHKDRAAFLFVYIREAHPDSVLHVIEDDKESLQTIAQTRTLDERSRTATVCVGTLKLKLPVVVDRDDNAVNKTYAGWPNRLVVIDTEGKLAYISEPGPRGFKPADVADWLSSHAK